MPLEIDVINLNPLRKLPISEKNIKEIAKKILYRFGRKNGSIGFIFVGNQKIRSLNKKYMRRDRATDVLSFVLDKNSVCFSGGLVGDVYISLDMAHKNGKVFKTGFRKELILYVIHGILHLLGFGDKTKKEKTRIRRLERKLMVEFYQSTKNG